MARCTSHGEAVEQDVPNAAAKTALYTIIRLLRSAIDLREEAELIFTALTSCEGGVNLPNLVFVNDYWLEP